MPTNKQAEQRALEAAAQWTIQGREELDGLFGQGYAKSNPGLLGMWVRTVGNNYQTNTGAQTAGLIVNELANVAASLSNMSKHLAELARAAEGVATATNPPRKARR